MRDLARTILELQKPGVALVYGVATGPNTISLAGADTPVTLPAIVAVDVGDYCAVLAQGADRLILGPIT